MIRFAALVSALALAGAAKAELAAITIAQQAVPVADVATAPGWRVAGAWRLSSDHPGFGGFSGLAAVEGELLLLSDAGAIVRWKPGSETGEMAALPAACHAGTGKHSADAEAMAMTPDGLEIRVALERGNRLCGFSWGGRGEARPFDLAPVLPAVRNRGVEAMATLPRRGSLLIAEAKEAGSHAMLWFDTAARDTPTATMRYHPPAGFKPGDAAFLPDGRLLVVNRRFAMPDKRATVVTLGSAFAAEAGAELSGNEILRIASGPLAANYEGVAVEPHDHGATIWLISDDNFSNRSGTMLISLECDASACANAGGTIAAAAR